VSISINGGRRNAVNWLVDGVSDVDVGSNITLLSTPSLESIEEFKIITNGYQAEWPRSGGGIVNVVTKSGSSRFSGSGYEFLRSDKLNANSFFRNRNPDPAINSAPPALKYNNFGATVGGPIVPSKMFFFFSEELRRINRAPTALNSNTYDPAWLTDPTNANYVAPALRDANALRLLTLFPVPNVTGRLQFLSTQPTINNTRQEVARVDYDITPNYRLTGRYSHDNSFTEEPGGLFLGLAVPNVATTDTNVPGQVASAILRSTHGGVRLNELQFQYSGNRIADSNQSADRNLRTALGLNLPEVYPGNDLGVMPLVAISGLSTIGANQLFTIEYNNYTITDSFTWQRGAHGFKIGGLATFEQKNENASNTTQGSFSFGQSAGHTAFYNFLSGNADGSCGNACTYAEAQTDVTVHLRFNRYEMYAQDSWKPRNNVTVDYGLRYSLYPPVTDTNDVLTSFLPSAYVASKAPACANAACTSITLGTGDPLNGIIVAGRNSPYGRAVYAFDKTNIQPRVGVTWDPSASGKTFYRASYGVYYDQPLVGIFEQNSFTNPPYVNTVSILNARLSNPGSGTTATTSGVLALIGNGEDFKTPRTQQWNAGVQRQLYARGALEVSYVGSHGDHLIRPIDINYPQPADVLRLGSVNLARPYQGYGAITMRETTARSNYWGLLSSFRHNGGAAGSLTLNYTLSRSPAYLLGWLCLRVAVLEGFAEHRAEGAPRRLANRRFDRDQLGSAGFAHFGKHQRIPARRPTEYRRRSGRGPADGRPVLVQPECLRAGSGWHVRQFRAVRVAAARPQSNGPDGVEELDARPDATRAVPRRFHQRVQPHAMAGGPERQRPRQHVHRQPDDVQPVERHVRPDPEHACTARDSARAEVLLVRLG